MVKHFSELGDGRYLFRSMKSGGEHPALGPTTRQLGLRTNAGEESDITIDDNGLVHPGNEGLSVTPDDPMRLKPYRRPEVWGGKKSCPPVWCIRIDRLGSDLAYREDPRNPENHGFIVPAYDMPFDQYKSAIEATRELWEIVLP
jgi:hypothetical protein